MLLPTRPPYHLGRTLQCGQVFRWQVDGTGVRGVFLGRRVRLQQTPEGIVVWGLTAEGEVQRLRHYLGLDAPLAAIEQRLAQDPVLGRLLPQTSGIALLRQEPWECLISFIVSAFNNIPKIELSLDRLARRFGAKVAADAWGFPTAAHLAAASLRELRACALGYRAPYVRDVATLVTRGQVDLDALHSAEYGAARRTLLTLPGVGAKVADCVLLFAYGKGEAFPVDVWVKRAVERWYFRGRRGTERRISEFARDRFGSLAGYAQQHLFYFVRGTRPRRRAG
jgi:N-glycosylase/DNA lyase